MPTFLIPLPKEYATVGEQLVQLAKIARQQPPDLPALIPSDAGPELVDKLVKEHAREIATDRALRDVAVASEVAVRAAQEGIFARACDAALPDLRTMFRETWGTFRTSLATAPEKIDRWTTQEGTDAFKTLDGAVADLDQMVRTRLSIGQALGEQVALQWQSPWLVMRAPDDPATLFDTWADVSARIFDYGKVSADLAPIDKWKLVLSLQTDLGMVVDLPGRGDGYRRAETWKELGQAVLRGPQWQGSGREWRDIRSSRYPVHQGNG